MVQTTTPQTTRLVGQRLAAARIAWFLVVSTTVTMLAIAAPFYLIHLSDKIANLSPAQTLVLRNMRLQSVGQPSVVFGVEYAVIAAFVTISLVIYWKRSDDWVAMGVSAALVTYIAWTSRSLDTLTGRGDLLALMAQVVQATGHVASTAIFFVFPDGRFVPNWSRWLLPLLVVSAALWIAFPSTPLNFADPFQVTLAGFVLLMAWRGTGALALMYRYVRRATPVQKQQSKWVFAALTIGVLGYLAFGFDRFALPALRGDRFARVVYDYVGVPIFLVSILVVPVALAYAMLRYRLWEIDRIITRALVYGIMTSGVVLLYVLTILVFQEVLASVIGDQSGVAVATTTLLIAVLFHPLRRRLHSLINRKFYKDRYAAAKALEAFSASARSDIELARLTDRLIEVVGDAMRPASVSLWLRTPEHQHAQESPANPPDMTRAAKSPRSPESDMAR